MVKQETVITASRVEEFLQILCECLWYLVLFLVGLLDKRTSDFVQLSESRNNPDGLRNALLRGLLRQTTGNICAITIRRKTHALKSKLHDGPLNHFIRRLHHRLASFEVKLKISQGQGYRARLQTLK